MDSNLAIALSTPIRSKSLHSRFVCGGRVGSLVSDAPVRWQSMMKTGSVDAIGAALRVVGDAIHISRLLSPEELISQEPKNGSEHIQELDLADLVLSVTVCPACRRTTSATCQQPIPQIDDFLREKISVWRKSFCSVENLKLAVKDCAIDGPGESKQADIGIARTGMGEAATASWFIDGEKRMTSRGDSIAPEYQDLVEDYVQMRFGTPVAQVTL